MLFCYSYKDLGPIIDIMDSICQMGGNAMKVAPRKAGIVEESVQAVQELCCVECEL